MKNTISVIIPVYKVEQYLDKCVESVKKQTYKNIEIILVDDGSPDRCGELCDCYAKSDKRIKVIHKENGGLSSARNAGLDAATGEYIAFVDSDDWIDAQMYEKLLAMMVNELCDIAECGVNIAAQDGIDKYSAKENEVISGREATFRHLNPDSFGGIPRVAVWSKLFKASFWRDRRFPEGKIHEDYMLTTQALFEASRVGIVHEGLYFHLVTNAESIMNTKFGVKDLYLEEQYESRIKYYGLYADQEIIDSAKRNYYLLLLSLFWRCHFAGMIEERHYASLIRNKKKEIMSQNMPLKRKLEFVLFYLSPQMYIDFRHFYKNNLGTKRRKGYLF